jgi:hypothetical protein
MTANLSMIKYQIVLVAELQNVCRWSDAFFTRHFDMKTMKGVRELERQGVKRTFLTGTLL